MSSYNFQFKLRAECVVDVDEFTKILNDDGQQYEIKKSVEAPFPDVDVDIACNLDLPQMRCALELVPDGHVMLETLNYANKYTGKRYHNFF